MQLFISLDKSHLASFIQELSHAVTEEGQRFETNAAQLIFQRDTENTER